MTSTFVKELIKMPASKRFKGDADEALKTFHYFEEQRKKAVATTKSRRRTNNIYDPEYCAYWEGHQMGAWMALTGARQLRTDAPPGFLNLPTVIESLQSLERRLKRARTKVKKLKQALNKAKTGSMV